MKTFKKLIAVILSIMAISGLCVTNAFAYDFGETVELTFDDGDKGYYLYAGEAFEGDNYVEYKEEYGSSCFFNKFVAKESGNYSFVNSGYDFYELDGSVMKKVEEETQYYDMDCFFIYLEKGTYYITNGFYGCEPEPYDQSFSIEFLGEFEGVSYDKELFKRAVAYEDVDFYNKDLRHAGAQLNFSEANLEYQCGLIYIDREKELKIGENIVSFEILDYKFTETLTIVEGKDIIESIEVENPEDYAKRVVYYDSLIGGSDACPDEIIVNFADGTTKTVKKTVRGECFAPEYIFELANGREYSIHLEGGTEAFRLEFAREVFVSADAELRYATFIENVKYLADNVLILLYESFGATNRFDDIIDEFKAFCTYYMFNGFSALRLFKNLYT